MQLSRYCTAAALLAASLGLAALTQGSTVAAQEPASQPAPGDAEFTLFISGARVGVERVRMARAGNTWIISSTGQYGAPLFVTLNRFEVKYTADWQPIDLHIEATQTGSQGARAIGLATSFGVTTAINEIKQNDATTSKTDQVSARTVVLPNNFYASYEALAARLAGSKPGTNLPVYIAPQMEIVTSIRDVANEQIATPSGPLDTRRYDITFANPSGPLEASVTIDARARLVRVEIPNAGITLVRSDLATISTRSQPIRNPTDTDVIVPASGFSLAGTMTFPPGTGRLRHPAVVLVAGSGDVERDEVVAGIPIFAQLAGSLAERGFAVLRYDKRGIGQSGGRHERATLQDYADDLASAIKWLSNRDDIDPRRITVVGHSEGGAVALLAAERQKRIASIVSIAAPGTTGADLILEQQRHVLDVMKVPDPERQAKIDLQQKIQSAVIADKGWEGLPADVRAQADSAWFRSLLVYDPAKVMPRVKQPIMIIQGDLDTQVFPHHADKLATLARARKKSPPVELLHLPGINHLLVPAATGAVSEYRGLKDKTVSPAVSKAIADWLKK